MAALGVSRLGEDVGPEFGCREFGMVESIGGLWDSL